MVEVPGRASGPNRGRPRSGDREVRRDQILEVAETLLVQHGPGSVTMSAVAIEARASKGTLYHWFGSRTGLLQAVVERNVGHTAATLHASLADSTDVREILLGYARGLLALLTSDVSLALNRAGVADPALASMMLEVGRKRISPLLRPQVLEQYLPEAASEHTRDPGMAFRLFYGLVVTDLQARMLLGEPAPGAVELEERASTGVDQFLTLVTRMR